MKAKQGLFMCDFILFLKNKITSIFELEYMCSVFTFVQYIFRIVKEYVLVFFRSTVHHFHVLHNQLTKDVRPSLIVHLWKSLEGHKWTHVPAIFNNFLRVVLEIFLN